MKIGITCSLNSARMSALRPPTRRTTKPAATTAATPLSGSAALAAWKSTTTSPTVRPLLRRSGTDEAERRKSAMSAPPTRPSAAPATKRPASAGSASAIASPVDESATSSATAAAMAPSASPSTPSVSSTVATLRCGRSRARSGPMTVGPVTWVPAQHVVRERGGGDRGERSANAQEPADRPLGAAHAIEIQREPALEEDQRDGDANEDLQARSELGGTDQIGAIGTEQHAGREHQDEAREAQRARQDLRSDAGAERQRDGPADGVVVSFHSLLGSRRAPRADPLGGSARADGGVSAPSRRGPGGSRGTRGRAPRRA